MMMFRNFSLGVLVGLLALSSLAAGASAQGRDRALDEVVGVTETLIIRLETGQATERQTWAGVQAATDALRRFVLAETEYRAEDKVAPPIVAGLRPGEAEADLDLARGDQETDLADVSNDWFNNQARLAQAAMDQVRSGLEQGAPAGDIAQGLRAVLAALSDMQFPPS